MKGNGSQSSSETKRTRYFRKIFYAKRGGIMACKISVLSYLARLARKSMVPALLLCGTVRVSSTRCGFLSRIFGQNPGSNPTSQWGEVFCRVTDCQVWLGSLSLSRSCQ
jgi:hypothetical protein